MTAMLKSEIESLTDQLAQLERENQLQAQQLSEATKRSQLLDEQVAKSDAHIKSLEELVENLKTLGGKVANESDSELTPINTESDLEETRLESVSDEVVDPSV